MPVYELVRLPVDSQDQKSLTHIGGYPNLPEHLQLPKCKLCGAPMTFFFQVQFPEKHEWKGKVMAIFACTSCADDNFSLMPPNGRHLGLPDYFLNDYEKRFCILVFEQGEISQMRIDYIRVLKHEKLDLQALRNSSTNTTRIGGRPNWRILDDSPKEYMGSRFTFLMQMFSDNWEWEFNKLPEAPQQAMGFGFGKPYRTDGKYELFYGLPLYFFGTLDLEQPKVYVLNQK